MHHVHWWLFALSFFIGLGLTFTLLAKGKPGAESESPTTKIPVADAESELPTTKIPVAEEVPTKIAVAEETSTTRIPVAEESPTTKIAVAEEARATRIPLAEEAPTRNIPAAPYAPYGPGSARAGAEGAGPAGWLVKGRSDTRLYYTPDDATYDRTVAQVWFKNEESAMRAFFTPWRKSSRK
jgi:uncharacterized membrane protein ArfC